MSTRQYPWILATVPWSDQTQFTRGTFEGLPLLSWGIAPKDTLATYRQLRQMGLRPGGADPVAVLYFHSRKGMRVVYANLYLIEHAKPVRPMTPAKRAAIEKACQAHRICPKCNKDAGVYIRPSIGICPECYRADEPDTGYLAEFDHSADPERTTLS
jgi:hypothetical protein